MIKHTARVPFRNSILVTASAFILVACGQAQEAANLAPEAEERHELMEGVRDAAKPLGGMLKGEVEFDAAVAMESLTVWANAAATMGDLFPEGSQGGEAAPAIWEDPDGFNAAIAKWGADTAAAIEAAPATLDDAKPVIGKAFENCKACHDTYRIEKD